MNLAGQLMVAFRKIANHVMYPVLLVLILQKLETKIDAEPVLPTIHSRSQSQLCAWINADLVITSLVHKLVQHAKSHVLIAMARLVIALPVSKMVQSQHCLIMNAGLSVMLDTRLFLASVRLAKVNALLAQVALIIALLVSLNLLGVAFVSTSALMEQHLIMMKEFARVVSRIAIFVMTITNLFV